MNKDLLCSLIRLILGAVSGNMVAKGYGDASAWEAVTGGAIAIATLGWSYWHQKQMKSGSVDQAQK